MRRRIGAAAVGLATLLVALPAFAHPLDEFTFEGGGWGHGVGMSQYGARAMAAGGAGYAEILTHYYSGTKVQALSAVLAPDHFLLTDGDPLWIGLEQNLTSVTFSAVGGPLKLCHASDCVQADATASVGETWAFETVTNSPGTCRFRRLSGPGEHPAPTAGPCTGNVTWVRDLATGVNVLGREYRRGSLRFRTPNGGSSFHASLEIGIQSYLNGLGEMPSSWPPEALKAQATAGRSYAIFRALEHGPEASLSQARKNTCWCHLFDSTLDQNYVGWSKESEGEGAFWGQKWVAAVKDTSGKVVTNSALPIQAFFMSSSGGVTENNSDVWNGSQRSYLVSVADSWSVAPEANNPNDDWQRTFTAQAIADRLGWAGVSSVELLASPPNAQIRFRGTQGEETVRSGPQLRTLFGLLSPHIVRITLARYYPFTDIEGNVHAEAIAAIWEAGITLGCGGELYCPDDRVTRAQMASFLARAAGLGPASGDYFSDDSGTHEENINRIFEAGITEGCSPGLYCPTQLITRGQMAKFLVGALDLSLNAPNHFGDDNGHRFEKYINAVAEARITLGCDASGTRFCPDDPVTRAQMASFLARAFLWDS